MASAKSLPSRRFAPPVRTIRSKLVVLHTAFSLLLGVCLLLALRAPIRELVSQSEERECRLAMELLIADPERAASLSLQGLTIRRGTPSDVGLDAETARLAHEQPGRTLMARGSDGTHMATRFEPETGQWLHVHDRSTAARSVVNRLYLLLFLSLLAVYAAIALTLEVFVLPRQVYGPIERLRDADLAVQEGHREAELIPDSSIPADELGEIMRSRNRSIHKLREQERQLGSALERVEEAATELQRKNHLLETARRNLRDQDRLASLGMMSAGIAHELNTPLAVLKGCVEDLSRDPARGVPAERAALMLRVVNRLERLSNGLLDFARARPPATEIVTLRAVIDEAWTLVSLDRGARDVAWVNGVPADLTAPGDEDRLTQVFVNLLRNGIDAMDDPAAAKLLTAEGAAFERDGRMWASVTIADSGPGIKPEIIDRLFEPFASTRLDAHGTGLGLAVAEGIVKEHGGLILARNAAPAGTGAPSGAVFEVMLPADLAASVPAEQATGKAHRVG